MTKSHWKLNEPGHWSKEASTTGTYHAERVDRSDGAMVWQLRYEGGFSSTIGFFNTLREAKDYADHEWST